MVVRKFDNNVELFFASLEKATMAKVLRAIELLEQFGHRLGMPHSKNIERRLFELRVRGMQEVRMFYTFHHGEAVLLHGYVKQSRRIPVRELAIARQKLQGLDEV